MRKNAFIKMFFAAVLTASVAASGFGKKTLAQEEITEFEILEETDALEGWESFENTEMPSDEAENEDEESDTFESEKKEYHFFSEEAEEFLEEEENPDSRIALYAAPVGFVQEGQPVRYGNGGFTPVTNGQAVFSSKYTRLGWNSNSEVLPWSQAGSSVLKGRKDQETVQGPYYVPLDSSAKGKFGFRITNVGFNRDANTSLDILLTCTDYLDYTYDNKGEKITDLTPLFGVSDSDLWLLFKDELPTQEIKVDIVKSGTNTPVSGNYRFRWLDIDLYQRFGIKLQNGSIGHRYATKDSVVCVLSKELFSKNYEVLTAPAGKVEGEVPENTVVYELDHSSGFYLAIISPGYGNYSKDTAKRIKNEYAIVKTGSCASTAGLQWDAKGYGPVEYPGLIKKVGNTLESQGDFNALEEISDAFYYTLQTEIPEEHPAYYYGSCSITDELPKGVELADYTAVKMLPSGKNVTSWFKISKNGDVVSFQASPEALALTDFYGKTYEFQIKVKMNPKEITPVYEENTCSYTVKNKASITCRHKNGQEGTSWSNEVVSRANIKRPETQNPQKWILSDNNRVKTKEYKGRDFETVYEISQLIPQNTGEWEIQGFHILDELADCFELKSAKVLEEQKLVAEFGSLGGIKGDWKLSVKNQLIKLSSVNALPKSCYGKNIQLQLRVGLRNSCNLKPYYVVNQNPDILEARVYNMASGVFEWNQGIPISVSGNTDKTEVIIKEDVSKGRITVRKKDIWDKELQGAVFEITAREDIYSIAGTLLLRAGETADIITTGENGTAVSKPLYMGRYTVKEVMPPKGYVISRQTYDVDVKEGDAEKTAAFQNEETLLRIKKISKRENDADPEKGIAGVSFIVRGKTQKEDGGKLYTTDVNGMIEIKGLVPGTYILREETTPDGYVANEKNYEFTIDENGLIEKQHGYMIVVENGYTRTEFLKTDKASQKPVSGATLRLTDAKGKTIDTWVSGKTPHRINRLAAGEYVLTELEAPKGYKKGLPLKCVVKNTESIQTFVMEDVKLVNIYVDKVIHGSEIVWAHGNPVFTFRVQGTDLDGEKHIYYDAVEFTKEGTDNLGDVKRSISFEVPAGEYTVSECKVMRYKLEKIDGVSGGSIEGQSVRFKLYQNQNGTAVFVNQKKSDRELTDNGIVRNVIIP